MTSPTLTRSLTYPPCLLFFSQAPPYNIRKRRKDGVGVKREMAGREWGRWVWPPPTSPIISPLSYLTSFHGPLPHPPRHRVWPVHCLLSRFGLVIVEPLLQERKRTITNRWTVWSWLEFHPVTSPTTNAIHPFTHPFIHSATTTGTIRQLPALHWCTQ